MNKSVLLGAAAIGVAAGAIGVMSSASGSKTVGVTMAAFDDNFLTVLRNGMTEYAGSIEGLELQVEDAEDDVGKQLNQVENFIAAGVDAIVVNAVDTSATQAISDAAAAAGIPLVYVNRQPINIDSLPDNQAFVASDEHEAGTLQAKEVCRLLKEEGVKEAGVLLLQGELSNQGAVVRTQMVHDTIATPDCSFMTIIEEQTGNWQRQQGADLMTNWITAGVEYHAVVANNDEMAIGALQALKSSGVAMDSVVVAGVDATQDALAAMQAGELDVTVFQDAAGQGKGAIDAALALAAGESVEPKVYIPFQLVTPANVQDYLAAN